MSKLKDLSTDIDSRINRLAKQIPNYAGKDSELAKLLDNLASGIDVYRAEVLREFACSDAELAEIQNVDLPGWRKRVSEAECKLQEQVTRAKFWEERYYSVAPCGPEFAEVDEPGSKDITVVSWVCCCNSRHTFTPPADVSWSHEMECHECGAKTRISPPYL